MKAWVITYHTLDNALFANKEKVKYAEIVVGVLSARNSSRRVKDYIEWLYMLLREPIQGHLSFARYTNPSISYKSVSAENYYGGQAVYCGSNPYIAAYLASDIILKKVDNSDWLEWTDPPEIIVERRGYNIDNIIKKSPRKKSALVLLPLTLDGFQPSQE